MTTGSTKFRFNATRVFLTYSQTPPKLTMHKLLAMINAKAQVDDYLIAVEEHEKGGLHLHAYFKFSAKLNTTDYRYFDLKYWGKVHHPSIVKVTSLPELLKYIRKDGIFISNFDYRPPWMLLLEAKTATQFLEALMYKLNRIDNYAGYRTIRDLHMAVLQGKYKIEKLKKE